MNEIQTKFYLSFFIAVAVLLTTGCTVATRDISPDEEVIYDEGYHFSDKKKIVNAMVDDFEGMIQKLEEKGYTPIPGSPRSERVVFIEVTKGMKIEITRSRN